MNNPPSHRENTSQGQENINQPTISQEGSHGNDDVSGGETLKISKYTKALIVSWKEDHLKESVSANKISVSQTVSFIAFLYEKMRNAVEFREEHLIKRAAIERIVKRRMLLNENGRDIAEVLIKELLWARYYENNSVGEEKIPEVQAILDKYFFIRNELSAGRGTKDQERIGSFVLEMLSCEIEENLSPDHKREAFTNYVYQMVRPQIGPLDGNEKERDIQAYIAVERAFTHNDNAVIGYHLLKLFIPEIAQLNWKTADTIIPRFFEIFQDIDKSLHYPDTERILRFVKKQMPPFFILRDIFHRYSKTIESILTDEEKLKDRVDESCRKKYEETKNRLRRTGVRSFIYIVLTKVIFAFVIEYPYDKYIAHAISYMPLLVNIVFPPILMGVIILSVRLPGDENTRKIFQLLKAILTVDPSDGDIKPALFVGKKLKIKSPVFSTIFSLFYIFTFLFTFGSIIYILTYFHFSIVSQTIFIFFVTLVTFFAYRVIAITKEYLVIQQEGALAPIFDFFFLPIMRVGQLLSDEVLTKFNVLIFFFDFIIEMPLKAIVEVIDEWAHFVRLKKDEIV